MTKPPRHIRAGLDVVLLGGCTTAEMPPAFSLRDSKEDGRSGRGPAPCRRTRRGTHGI